MANFRWGKRAKGLLLMLLFLLPVIVHAQFDYIVTANGTITITGYNGPDGTVIIPSMTNGYPVTDIGNSAFYENTSLSSVVVPNSVTVIESDAFADCYNLTNISIGSGVTNIGGNVIAFGGHSSIGDNAFLYCPSLVAITVDPQNPVYSSTNGVMFNNNQTTLVQFPGGLSESYTIPNSVNKIGFEAFATANLTGLTIPGSVTTIGSNVFSDCDSLMSIWIGSGVTNLDMFLSCPSLTNVTVDPENSVYGSTNGVLFNKEETMLIEFPEGLGGSYTVPDSVTNIGDEAFANANLTSLTIPNNVTSIGNNALYDCDSLMWVWLGSSITNLGEPFTSPSGVVIENSTFAFCPSLTNITVDPENPVYSSVNGVVFNKDKTTLIEFPEGLGGNYTIPDGVTNIGDEAFYQCGNLSGVFFQGDAPNAGFFVFLNDSATVYYLPGTTGWGNTFGGDSTALWLPQIQTSDGYFGIQTNQFGFNINWASGQTVVVEACTNLLNPVWQPIQTNTLMNSSVYFSDSQWTNYPSRYYRISPQ